MKTTSTFISWPCRLKIGAKTKKGMPATSSEIIRFILIANFILIDPHVRIVGKPEDVFKAKERILEFLDSKVSKSTPL